MKRARTQRLVVERVLELDGQVVFNYELDDNRKYVGGELTAPSWLRKMLTDDFFRELVAVECNGRAFTDKDVGNLADLASVEVLILNVKYIPEPEEESPMTDHGVALLKEQPDLESLYLIGTNVTDDGLKHLSHMSRLEHLCLDGLQITDAGLEHLRTISNLEFLSLRHTNVTDEGVAKLRQSLPDCEIEY